jgi:hypothetical protein
MTSVIAQVGVAFTGVTAIFLTQCGNPKLARYACLFGLAGEPFWFWSAGEAHQWGVVALAFLYTFAWGKGAWLYWVKPRVRSK